ncbi:MAG: DUF2892 domain-containing protein [Candidatus Omnitrophota bacterium]
MKKNMGIKDRILRIVMAVLIFALGFKYGSWWGLVGLIPLFTGMMGWCGLYKLFRINTCEIKKK